MQRESLDLADRLLDGFPGDPEALGLRGLVLHTWGHGEEAERCWEACLTLDPGNARAAAWLGKSALGRGDYAAAATWLRLTLLRDSNNPEASISLGRALKEDGKTKEAAEVLQRHVAAWPKATEAFFFLGESHLRLRDYPAAKACFQRVVDLEPGAWQGYFGLMTACARLGEIQSARQFERKFRELRTKARSAADSKRLDHGEERALKTRLANTVWWVGTLNLQRGRTADAEAHARRAAEVDPLHTESRMALARLLAQQGRLEEALSWVRELQRIQPSRADHWLLGGELLRRLGRLDAAEAAFRKAVELDPANAAYRQTYEQWRRKQ
jgi:Flp pilus assembly protein TadD